MATIYFSFSTFHHFQPSAMPQWPHFTIFHSIDTLVYRAHHLRYRRHGHLFLLFGKHKPQFHAWHHSIRRLHVPVWQKAETHAHVKAYPTPRDLVDRRLYLKNDRHIILRYQFTDDAAALALSPERRVYSQIFHIYKCAEMPVAQHGLIIICDKMHGWLIGQQQAKPLHWPALILRKGLRIELFYGRRNLIAIHKQVFKIIL